MLACVSEKHVVLIGMGGIGKPTLGPLVADWLGREFWDNDVGLSEATGRTAAEV
jgi:shikimate kinase